MNWGTGIVIAFVLFIAMIFTFIFLGSKEPSDLVSDDYYAKELAYEDVIVATRNTFPFEDSIHMEIRTGQLELTMPTTRIAGINGQIHFFRPSEADLDKFFPLSPDSNGKQYFDLANFVPGKYIVKITWAKDGSPYYWEEDIFM
jgi:hypothetical protein